MGLVLIWKKAGSVFGKPPRSSRQAWTEERLTFHGQYTQCR